jgi:hypothetical protein
MQEKLRVIKVDGADYPVRFNGFDRPMEVRAPNGETLMFQPWRYRDHMAALNLCLNFGPKGLELDGEMFCGCVMRGSGIPENGAADFHGMALWWAGGGNQLPPDTPIADGWLDLGSTRVKLEPWSNENRIRALADSLIRDASGESLEVVHYLDTMVGASVKSFNPKAILDKLDSGATATLIAAVISINMPEAPLPVDGLKRDSLFSVEQSRSTLRLCAALGWTPSKVWQTPAAEVDRLLTLLDQVQPAPSRQFSRRLGLADQPDAVVIHFEED